MNGTDVKTMVLVTAMAVILVLYAPKVKNTSPDLALGRTVEEFVPGTKRQTDLYAWTTGEPLGKPDVVFDLEVKRAQYMPNELRVRKGQVVRVRLHGKDNGLADLPELQRQLGLATWERKAGHGFHIMGPYDVWVTGIRQGVTREVTFKATEAGEFDFECVVFCSSDHYLMRGRFVVEE